MCLMGESVQQVLTAELQHGSHMTTDGRPCDAAYKTDVGFRECTCFYLTFSTCFCLCTITVETLSRLPLFCYLLVFPVSSLLAAIHTLSKHFKVYHGRRHDENGLGKVDRSSTLSGLAHRSFHS